uniref:Uncharacterized protein n=1 Tax=Oryza brachyantha TaxID=4533 RepID=J3LHV2_ORYBR
MASATATKSSATTSWLHRPNLAAGRTKTDLLRIGGRRAVSAEANGLDPNPNDGICHRAKKRGSRELTDALLSDWHVPAELQGNSCPNHLTGDAAFLGAADCLQVGYSEDGLIKASCQRKRMGETHVFVLYCSPRMA